MRGRPYCKVSPRLVTGSFGRSVRGEGREALLAQSLGQGYVCNCPHGNAIGLFFLPIGYIMADKGWSEQTTKEALGAIQQRGLIQYNWQTEWCWVIEDFRHEFGPDPDRRAGDLDERGNVKKEDSRIPLIRDLVQEAAGSGLLGAFMAHHQPHYPYLLGWWNAPSDAPLGDEDTPRGTPRSRARVRVQEQEQEVEQEQEDTCAEPLEAERSTPPAVGWIPYTGQDPTRRQSRAVPEQVESGEPEPWSEMAILETDLAPLRIAYPGVDVGAELKKARSWCLANGTQRKTARGIPRFLNSWMERAQNGSRVKPVQGNRPRVMADDVTRARRDAEDAAARKEWGLEP